jgi:hypothetical protein
MNGHRSTASIDKRMPERLERWMLLVSSATMMPTTMYPEGQYQYLRNHIRSTGFRTRTRDGRLNSGLSDRSVCVLLKVLAARSSEYFTAWMGRSYVPAYSLTCPPMERVNRL